MSFPAYPQYKNTATTWLGAVPSHWRAAPFWSLFRRVKLTGFPNEQLLSVYRDYGVIRKAERDDNFNKPSEDLSTYQLVEKGDLAINKMKAWQGSLGVSPYTGIVSPAYFVYSALHREDARYLHYLLRSPQYTAGYLSLSKGIRVNQWDLDPAYHSRMPVLLPPLAEQRAIATFLDRETAQIDTLIEEQQRLIALIEEKRQAVISHAVTKGLDPDVPMKDSGIEWLGVVPAHWKVSKLGYRARLQSGFAFASGDFGAEGIPVVRMNNLSRGRLDFAEAACIPVECVNPRVALSEGDLVWGMSGSIGETGSLGNFARVSSDDLPCQLNQRVGRFVVREGLLATDFLELLIQSSSFKNQVLLAVTGTAQFNVSSEQVEATVAAFPPVPEQQDIAHKTRSTLNQHCRAREETLLLIRLLQERRSALISAAVTGKIDVRDLVGEQAEAA